MVHEIEFIFFVAWYVTLSCNMIDILCSDLFPIKIYFIDQSSKILRHVSQTVKCNFSDGSRFETEVTKGKNETEKVEA